MVKYTAEHHADDEKQKQVWRTAGSIALIGSAITAVTVSLFSNEIAKLFLKDESFSTVFIWFSITLVFYVFNTMLLSILNGKKEIYRYIIANIAGSLFSLIVTTILTVNFGLHGALTALAIHPSLGFIITAYLCYKADWFKFSYLFGRLDREVVINLSKYTAMALTSASCVPISHILIRTHLTFDFGEEAAGYWEAMWRLSGAYLMLVTTTLSLYYLPRLSELNDPIEIKKEIVDGYKVIIPVITACGLIIYLLRDFIIAFLFSQEFTPMRELFAWQLIGDTLKIGSWILAYLMLGQAMIKLFIISEVVFAATFYGWTYLLTGLIGLEGAALAHSINYLLYWMTMSFFIGRTLSKRTAV